MTKVMVAYEHNPADHQTIHLAVTPRGARPADDAWVPALRDTVNGKRVVWARFADDTGTVWVRDTSGDRPARRI